MLRELEDERRRRQAAEQAAQDGVEASRVATLQGQLGHREQEIAQLREKVVAYTVERETGKRNFASRDPCPGFGLELDPALRPTPVGCGPGGTAFVFVFVCVLLWRRRISRQAFLILGRRAALPAYRAQELEDSLRSAGQDGQIPHRVFGV